MPDGETNDTSMKRKIFENAIRYIDKLNLNECDKSIVGFMILWTAYNSSYNMSNFHGNDQSRFIQYFTSIAERYVVEHRSEIVDGFFSRASDFNVEKANYLCLRDLSVYYDAVDRKSVV